MVEDAWDLAQVDEQLRGHDDTWLTRDEIAAQLLDG